MKFPQLAPGLDEGPEGGRKGDARHLPLEIGREGLPVVGVMQQGVYVVEDVPLGDFIVIVVGAEASQRPVGDVLLPIAPVFVIGVEGEAL